MYIQIFKEIDRVVIRGKDRKYIGHFEYSTYSSEIDYIISNLLPTEAILPNNVYEIGVDNQIKIYRILLNLI